MNKNYITLDVQEIDKIKKAVQVYNDKPRVVGQTNNLEAIIVERLIYTLITNPVRSYPSDFDNTTTIVEEKRKEEEKIEVVQEKYNKGWDIDNTLHLDVDIKTMFDILRPLQLLNEHEKRIITLLERIYPYITQSDKYQKNKNISQSLKNEIEEIKFEYVRHIYRQAATIAIDEYNKLTSV